MNDRYAGMRFAVASLTLPGGIADATDPKSTKGACRVCVATIFGTEAVAVKDEDQRVGKTHAVDGSVQVRGRRETLQCPFDPEDHRIERFIVDDPAAYTAELRTSRSLARDALGKATAPCAPHPRSDGAR